nr:DNA mismatch repair endonuclease MutL [Lachnospiraceae bacterium]
NFEIYYVNQRYIKSKYISRALDEAYKPYLMLHKYPFVLLYFDIPYDEIDVNVHPSKLEVRFLNAEPLYDLIVHSIRDTLKKQDMTVEVKSEQEKAPSIEKAIPEPFEERRRMEEFGSTGSEGTEIVTDLIGYGESAESVQPGYSEHRVKAVSSLKEEADYSKEASYNEESESETVTGSYDKSLNTAAGSYDKDLNTDRHTQADFKEAGQAEATQLSFHSDERFLSREAVKKHRIIGQVFKTYWMIEMEDELYIIDQHAAHEKIKYERLIKQLHEKKVYSQMIAPSEIVTLTGSEEELLKTYFDQFSQCGFEIESFGGNEYRISAVPTDLYGLTVSEYFHEILDSLTTYKASKDIDEILHHIATMACKSAVKGNTEMTFQEASALIDELMGLENPYHCPHGRPTVIKFRKSEIEKMFKRIV